MKRDLLKRAGQIASLGLKHFSVTEERALRRLPRRDRARSLPGAAALRPSRRSRRRGHREPLPQQEELAHLALNIREYISADEPADGILRGIRRQGVFSIACHLHPPTTRRIEVSTCVLAAALRANVDVALMLYRDGSWAA
jgi:hypothetical protein